MAAARLGGGPADGDPGARGGRRGRRAPEEARRAAEGVAVTQATGEPATSVATGPDAPAGRDVRAGRRADRPAGRRRDWLPYVLLAPTVFTVVAVIVYPVLTAIQLSFQRIRLPQ